MGASPGIPSKESGRKELKIRRGGGTVAGPSP